MTTNAVFVPRIVPYAAQYEAQVLELAHAMHAESVFHRDIAFDDAKFVQQIEAAAALPDYYLALCVRDNEVLGGFLGCASSVYFSHDKVAKDLAWFVKPSRRGSLAAVLLVADFERWGREKAVAHFILGQSTGVRVETTEALYKHLGYTVVGSNTMKRA
jgi:hypothetical protein